MIRMDAQKEIKMLKARCESLQKTVNQLMKPPEVSRVHLVRIPHETAVRGFDYPSNLRHIWVDYRDSSVFMVLPVEKADNVKSSEAEGKA